MPDPKSAGSDRASSIITVLFFVAIGIGMAWNDDRIRPFLIRWWWGFAIGAAVVVVISIIAAARGWTAKGRLALIIYGAIPSLMMLVFGVAFLKDAGNRVMAARFVFLVVATLLPPTMFYLFVFTRKDSLLNEFIANLDRLGLLRPPDAAEDGAESRRTRVRTYLLRFQAAYGPLNKNLVNPILEKSGAAGSGTDTPWDQGSFSDTDSIIALETTVPVIAATILIALGWLTSLPPQGGAQSGPGLSFDAALIPQMTPVSFAFLGAYVFSLQMLFWRYVRKDLRPNAYMALALRMILATLSIWAASIAVQVMDQNITLNQLLVLGFTIGFLPRVAWQLIAAAAKKGGRLALPSLGTSLPITDLAGLTVWHESRLQEEDIENIPNMATADIAELMLNTRFPPDRIVDWVDEAILYTHVGPKWGRGDTSSLRALLASNGIRTASGLIEAWRSAPDRAVFEKVLPASHGGPSPVRTLIDTLPTNPNLALIQRWRRLSPLTAAERDQPGVARLEIPLRQPGASVTDPAPGDPVQK